MNLGNLNPNNQIFNDRWRSPDVFGARVSKLATIIRHPRNIPVIEGYVLNMHELSVHTLRFLKLLYVHHFNHIIDNHSNQRITELIPLNKELIINIAKTIGVTKNIGQGRTSPATINLRLMLSNFYENFYMNTLRPGEPKPSCTHLHTPIDYFAVQVLTMFENNIKQHFHKYVVKYVDCYRDKVVVFNNINNNNYMTGVQKTNAKNLFKTSTNAIVKDILCTTMILNNNGQLVFDYRSNEDPDLLNMMKEIALPNRPILDINDDLERFPFDYIHGMLRMVRLLEQHRYKLPSLFPLRSTDIPCHLTIDTSTMIDMLYPTKDDVMLDPNYCDYVFGRTGGRSKSKASEDGWMKNNENLLWSTFFKTEIDELFHGYRELDHPNIDDNPFVDNHEKTFHRMIRTNGIAASIIMVRKNAAVGRQKPKNPRYKYVEPYANELSPQIRAQLQACPNFVGIDPNMRDLLYAVKIDKDRYNNAENNNDHEEKVQVMKEKVCWRHTQDERRRKLRIKKNRKWLQKKKKETIVNNLSIQSRESRLGRYCKKSLNFVAFQQYCRHKSDCSFYVATFYREKKHRNRQFKQYVSQQKLDSELINQFRKKFGPPATTVVFMGNWSESRHRKFHEPVKGKGFRDLFRKAGYKVLLVKEHKTSKMCSECQVDGAICVSFRRVKNPRPKMRQRFPTVICHGLVKCTRCHRLWNRDPNAASNIWVAANSAVYSNARPQYLGWAHNNQMDIDE